MRNKPCLEESKARDASERALLIVGHLRRSSIVNTLSFRRVNPNLYEVEGRTHTLGSHMVTMDEHKEWRCDCMAYATLIRCSHIATVLRAEAEARAARQALDDACCGCRGPAGDMIGCTCSCHSVVSYSAAQALVAMARKRTLESLWPDD